MDWLVRKDDTRLYHTDMRRSSKQRRRQTIIDILPSQQAITEYLRTHSRPRGRSIRVTIAATSDDTLVSGCGNGLGSGADQANNNDLYFLCSK